MKVAESLKLIGISLLFAVGLSACEKPGPAESAGKKIDQTVDKAGDKVDEAGHKVGTQVEKAGVAIDDAAAKAKAKRESK